MAVFEKHEVTAVFSGHDHNYQRHLKNGVTYVVTGGGGAPLYDVDGPIPGITQKVERTEHFVSIKVEPGKVVLDAEALDGHRIELVELRPYARSRSSN
jgi:2',3'-cyclic-nucleotide 2'-phosphodiesterase (5'-nucleotidase family)